MIRVYWDIKIKRGKRPVTSKRRVLIHFYIQEAFLLWYSIDFKVFGNKRIRPTRILGGQRWKNFEIAYNKYEWTPKVNRENSIELEEDQLYKLIDGDDIRIGQTLKREIVRFLLSEEMKNK